MFKHLADVLGLYCLMEDGGCRTLLFELLRTLTGERESRDCAADDGWLYLLTCSTSWVWAGVLGCSGHRY